MRTKATTQVNWVGFFYGVWAKGRIRDQKTGFSEWIKSLGTALQTSGLEDGLL